MNRWLKSNITLFLAKVVGIFVIWYIIYDLWLLPDGRVDRWLCLNVIDVSSDFLLLFRYDVFWEGRVIGLSGTAGVELIDGCSGISAIGLFIGFVIAYPGRWVPRICFIIIGIGVIYLANIVRIIMLVITQKYWAGIFGFTHDYSTTAIFYLIIFFLWVGWVNWGDKKVDSVKSTKSVAT